MLEHEFYERCENIAARVRSKLKIAAYAPLSSRSLAAHLLIDVVLPDALPGLTLKDIHQASGARGWSAITVLTEPPIIIAHPSRNHLEAESDIMHELAHLLMKHKPEMLCLISEYRVARRYSKTQETQADALGDCLQLPRPALHYARQRGCRVEEITQRYCISVECYNRRIEIISRFRS
ncbi:MAG: ImmA/IrrE family metallo-endopeptidase [Anaerolinea sp.]|nr:ImmA/IrrE family metallo-endopeptidase [Anaerolinea sp.]